jgi:chitodextrinase
VDAAGNTSAPTATIGASTSACQGDTQPPSTPTQLQATATTQTSISLAWTASTDDVGVAGYRVYDGSALVASPTNTNVAITGITCGTPHSFTVVAFDAAGNLSSPSGALQVSTAACGGGTTLTFTPVADAYVDENTPSANLNNAKLRVDTSQVVRSYLRFDVTGLTGPVQKVTLRIFATSGLTAGYDVRGVADTTWGESTITYANAPPTAATITGSSGPVVASSWTTVDVTPLVTGNGVFSIALTGRSTTALAFASKETATPPQLVVNTS